jgi:hypothetical protein
VRLLKFESKQYRGRQKHHLTPRSKNGDDEPENILLLNMLRHQAWHILFGHKSLEEVIQLLLRLHSAKNRCLYKKLGVPNKCPLAEGLCTRTNGDRRQASRSVGA